MRTPVEILKERCRNCGMCLPMCPKNAIFRINDKCVINRKYCDDCEICIQVCPVNAIKMQFSLKNVFSLNVHPKIDKGEI